MSFNNPSKLEKIAAGVSGAIVSAEYVLCYNNYDGLHASGLQMHDRFRWLPIHESNFGDAHEIFAAVLASGFMANKIEEYGQRKRNKIIEYFGRYFPAITAAAAGAYYSLGETIFPQILPGTADVKDVPAVIITALVSPVIANYVRKQWRNEWKEKLQNLVTSINRESNKTQA
jgi:hypothetical protein